MGLIIFCVVFTAILTVFNRDRLRRIEQKLNERDKDED